MSAEPAAAPTGGCQCGAVRYRLEATPTGVNVCYCRMCQKAGGGPLMAFGGVKPASLVWMRGAPKMFASSAFAERGFCAECGTPLTYRQVGRERVSITLGSLDDPASVAPTIQYGVESKPPWIDTLFDLPARRTGDWLTIDARAFDNHQHPDHDT